MFLFFFKLAVVKELIMWRCFLNHGHELWVKDKGHSDRLKVRINSGISRD